MPTFKGPVEYFQYPTGSRLLDRMRPSRGVTVYTLNGGTTWQQNVFPYQGDIQQGADPTKQLASSMTEGVDYFLGGRTYTITSAQAAILTAAGFGAYIT